MDVNVDELFAKIQYEKMLEELYLINVCSSNKNSSYTIDEKQKDNFLKFILNESNK